jgi:hypothetical protein
MKTVVLAVLLIAVAFAVAYFVFSKPSYPFSEKDAQRFFLEDLTEKYPNADVREVIEILPMTTSEGAPYYQLKARVTSGLYSPCPERVHIYYDYPPKNFVAQPPEYITRGCKVCINEAACTLAFPEEAVIASHSYPGAEEVASFVRKASDARATALLLDSYDGQAGVWMVRWSSASSADGYTVYVSKPQNKVLLVNRGIVTTQ